MTETKAVTRIYNLVKDTKHSVVYEEQTKPGEPPVAPSIYIQKWFAGEAKAFRITLEPITP